MNKRQPRCGECSRFGADAHLCWYRNIRRTAHNPACQDYTEE